MTSSYTPTTVSQGFGQETAMNTNFTDIKTALDESLIRTNSVSNAMAVDLDISGNQLLNLPSPGSPTEPVRLQDLPALAGITVQVGTKSFTTVAGMKADTSLVSGEIVVTKGYTTVNDKGNATYVIQTSAEFGGTPDEQVDHTLGTGDVAVFQHDDFISPKQAGAVGDGVANDNTALTDLVAYAKANNITIDWVNGTYLTTVSILDLHNVRHTGEGTVERGSDTFSPDPDVADTNNLYVATTGSSTNDGLSSSEPMLKLQEAADTIEKYSKKLGIWIITPADGTYTDKVLIDFTTTNPIQIVGSAWTTTPNVLLDGATTQTNMVSVRKGAKIRLEKVKVADCTDNNIEAFDHSEIDAFEIHSTNAGLSTTSGSNFYIANNSRGFLNGECLIQTCSSSEGLVLAYGGSIISMGQAGTDATDSPTLDGVTTGTTARGVQARHSSLIKMRSVFVDACQFGVYCETSARISHETGQVDNCTFAYFSRGGGHIVFDDSNVTYTGNTSFRYAARDDGVYGKPIQTDDATWRRVGLFKDTDLTNSVLSTATTVDILTVATSLLAQDFNEKGRGIKAVIYGNISGTGGTKTLSMSGSVGGLIRSITLLTTDTGDFKAEITTTALSRSSGTVDVLTEADVKLDGSNQQYVNSLTTDSLTAAQDISLAMALSATPVTITIHAVEIYQSGT